MATDRRNAIRSNHTDRRQPGQQFGRGTGAFADVVNVTFALIRKREAENAAEILESQEAE